MSESVIPADAPSATHPDGPDRMNEAPVATLVVGPISQTEPLPTPVPVEPASDAPVEPHSMADTPAETPPTPSAATSENGTAATPEARATLAPPEAVVVPPVATILDGTAPAPEAFPVEGPAPTATIVSVEPLLDRSPEAPMVPATDGPVPQIEALEYRVRRLENTVSALQDTRVLEDRVSERIANRLSRKPGKTTMREKASVIIDVGRRLLPLTAEKPEPPPAQPAESAAGAGPPPTAAPPAPEPPPAQSIWLVFDIYSEGLAILRMFIDPHYRMPWRTRLIPLILFAAILTSWYWLPGTGFLNEFPGLALLARSLDKMVDLFLAFFLFKILGREAQRYQKTFPTLASKLRS